MIVLIAETDKETIENISMAFKMCLPDCQLEITNSKKECLEIARSKNPNIIILDSYLLNGNSFCVIEKIRSFSEVPIVFLSNTSDESEVVSFLEGGGDAYIKKPIRQLEFIAHVRALLRKNSILSNKNAKYLKEEYINEYYHRSDSR